MIVKEAIKTLDSHNNFVFVTTDKLHEAIDVAIEALEKQIPKNPIIKKVHPSIFAELYCPCCGDPLHNDVKFCSECGQALIEWEFE